MLGDDAIVQYKLDQVPASAMSNWKSRRMTGPAHRRHGRDDRRAYQTRAERKTRSVSEVQHETQTFFALYSDGLMSAGQIDDFIEEEKRSLSEYLGMTDDECAVWVMPRGALPSILASRREQRLLAASVAEYLADLERSHPVNRLAIHALSDCLARRAHIASGTYGAGA
jgi:hypothetical protein